MKKKSMKTLAVTLACTMALGAVPPSTEVAGLPAFAVTAEAAKASKKLTLSASGKTINAGTTIQLNVKTAAGAKVTYKSSKRSVASVNANGVVTGKKAGTAKITITAKKAGFKTAKKTVTIKVKKQKQTIYASNQTIAVGQSLNLGAKGKTSLTYKTSNKKVATVNSRGVIVGKKTGTVKITITSKANGSYNKATRTITVKVVKKAPVPVKQPETEPIRQPETEPVKTPDIPKQTEAPSQPETPKQTETSKETESERQTETSRETESEQQTEAPAPISYVTSMYFDETSKTNTVYIGEPKESALKWTATGTTTRKDFVYTSSDESVATVDENGIITGLKTGTVTITATSKTPFSANGSYLYDTQSYRIKARTTEINSMYYPVITGEDAITEKNISIGETKECTLHITSTGNGSTEDINFTSSDPSVATVDENGNVTGLSKGYVTITAKSKLPSKMDGETILTSSTTYHVGEYTYEEILSGLIMDTEANWSAHETMNDLRQNPSHRNFFKDYPSYPTREWSEIMIRPAAARASRNIVCVILGGWYENEMSTINPLASHRGALNGYGGGGWESTGANLGEAASVFFEDIGHFSNEVDPSDKYEAIAVVQYKNPAGVNLTSMIVQAGSYPEEASIKDELRAACMPESQFMDFCRHFGIPTTDPEVAAEQVLDEDLLPVEDVTESTTEVPDDVIIQEEDVDADQEMVIEEIEEEQDDEMETEVFEDAPEEILEEEVTE